MGRNLFPVVLRLSPVGGIIFPEGTGASTEGKTLRPRVRTIFPVGKTIIPVGKRAIPMGETKNGVVICALRRPKKTKPGNWQKVTGFVTH